MMSRPSQVLHAAIREGLPFVNRANELTFLTSLFDQAAGGQGQVVFVSGEGGVGKTRLIHETGKYAARTGAVVALGPSFEGESLIPYSPWIEGIRSFVHQLGTEAFGRKLGRTVAEVGRLVPELAARAQVLGITGWLSGPKESFISATDAERIRLFQAVTDFLTHLTEKNSLFLFFDDLQWADTASLQLLRYFCRRIRENRVMVAATFRETELNEDHPLVQLTFDLNRERILHKLVLDRLTTDNVALIISNHFGSEPVAPEFTKLVYSRTGGNPFFVEELLRSITDDKRAHKSEQGWTLQEIAQVEIPSTVRSLIRKRIFRLGSETVQVLTIGAIIGMEFEYELLSKVSGDQDEHLMSLLETAVGTGLLRERHVEKDVSYLFSDEQIRDFLIEDLSLIRKKKLHGRVAQATEELYKRNIDRHLEELAGHYIEAGDYTRAAEFSLRAGDRAAMLRAQPEAKKHYQNVLDLLEEERLTERLEVFSKLGDVSFRLGEFEESIQSYRKAVDTAEALKQKRTVAQLYSKLGYVHWFNGNSEAGLKNYKQGLAALADEKDTPEEAAICQNIARLLVNSPEEADNGIQWCERAIAMAKRLNYYEVLAHALQTLALELIADKKNKEDIFRYLEDSLKISMEHGLEDPICRVHENLAIAYYFIKLDYAMARNTLAKGVEYAKKTGHSNYEALLCAELALHGHIPLGEWDKALEVATQSLKISSELGDLHLAYSLVPLGVANLEKGNLERAEEYLTRAVPLARKSRWIEVSCYSHLALGRLYMRKNMMKEAKENLMAGLDVSGQRLWAAPVEFYFELVKLHLALNELDEAQVFYQKLRKEWLDLDEKGIEAFERWAYGLISASKADWIEASQALKRSSDLWTQLGHPYNQAQVAVEAGDAFMKAGNEDRAKKIIEDARTVLERLGATLDLAELSHRFQPLLK